MFFPAILSLLHLFAFSVGQSEIPLLSFNSCQNLCRSSSDCPAQSSCQRVVGIGRCGVCVCNYGRVAVRGKCVLEESKEEAVRVEAARDPNPRVVKIEEPLKIEEVEKTIPFPSNDWNCEAFSCKNDESCRRISKPIKCGSEPCHGSCVKDDNGRNEFCVCPYSRAGLACDQVKIEQCPTAEVDRERFTQYHNRRYQHVRKPFSGSIFARHLVPNLDHCVQLCLWAGESSCRSINYGTTRDGNVCELLRIQADPTSPLNGWLRKDSSWTYGCCFPVTVKPRRSSRFLRLRSSH